jgi:6-phosphofructokinase 1
VVEAGRFGVMVALKGLDMVEIPLDAVKGEPRLVSLESELLVTARALGVSLGD